MICETAYRFGMQALGSDYDSATRLSKGWEAGGNVFGDIINLSRVLYPCPGFLSWPTQLLTSKKHCN